MPLIILEDSNRRGRNKIESSSSSFSTFRDFIRTKDCPDDGFVSGSDSACNAKQSSLNGTTKYLSPSLSPGVSVSRTYSQSSISDGDEEYGEIGINDQGINRIVISCNRNLEANISNCDEVDEGTQSFQPTIFMHTNGLNVPSLSFSDHEHHEIDYQFRPAPMNNLSKSRADLWIAINTSPDGKSCRPSPLVPYANDELYRKGVGLISNAKLWTAETKTSKYIKAYPNRRKHGMELPMGPVSKACLEVREESDNSHWNDVILQWSGALESCNCVRAEGIIGMKPEDLFQLLLDSDRVKEFNKFSSGRNDLWVMKNDAINEEDVCDDFTVQRKCVTKVVSGQNKAPLGMKPIPFTSFMHGRELPHGAGYIILCRTVRVVDAKMGTAPSPFSDIKISVNAILRIDGSDDKCLLVNASQFKSPLPSMVTRKLSLAACVTMIQDIRRLKN